MTSTARYPALDGRRIALLSRGHDEELRGRLGFRGVAITDDLDVTALRGLSGPGALAVGATRAGNDVLLFAQDPGRAQRGLNAESRGGRPVARGRGVQRAGPRGVGGDGWRRCAAAAARRGRIGSASPTRPARGPYLRRPGPPGGRALAWCCSPRAGRLRAPACCWWSSRAAGTRRTAGAGGARVRRHGSRRRCTTPPGGRWCSRELRARWRLGHPDMVGSAPAVAASASACAAPRRRSGTGTVFEARAESWGSATPPFTSGRVAVGGERRLRGRPLAGRTVTPVRGWTGGWAVRRLQPVEGRAAERRGSPLRHPQRSGRGLPEKGTRPWSPAL